MYKKIDFENIGKIGKILIACALVLVGIIIPTLLQALTATNWISILAILIPMIFSFIAINQTKKAALNSERIIEEANRPYIVPHVEVVTTDKPIKYLSIKNYGKTSGKILNIQFFGNLDERHNKSRLLSLKEITMAPEQNIISEFSIEFEEMVQGQIQYLSPVTQKIYTEEFKLNFSTDGLL